MRDSIVVQLRRPGDALTPPPIGPARALLSAWLGCDAGRQLGRAAQIFPQPPSANADYPGSSAADGGCPYTFAVAAPANTGRGRPELEMFRDDTLPGAAEPRGLHAVPFGSGKLHAVPEWGSVGWVHLRCTTRLLKLLGDRANAL